MCNMCTNSTSGCCNNCAQTFAATNTNCCFGGCGQRRCRDACGNIWVRQNNSRCCNRNCNCCCNRCCHCWDNFFNDFAELTNGNGNGCGCTACGRCCNGATTRNTFSGFNDNDWYYARQYGLFPGGGRSFCCGSGFVRNDD